MLSTPITPHRLRSFVRRSGRRTVAQERAYDTHWSACGLTIENDTLDFATVFGRDAPTYLEIGFGTGQSLLAIATAQPDKNWIGVETHRPGLGALMLGIETGQLTNLRAFNADVIDVLEKAIAPHSLAGVQIFFPDPWQKRRHHARRLVQPEFLTLLASRVQAGGSLHLATDWADYAIHMQQVLSAHPDWVALHPEGVTVPRSGFRPVLTKFERRALREGRAIVEFQYQKR